MKIATQRFVLTLSIIGTLSFTSHQLIAHAEHHESEDLAQLFMATTTKIEAAQPSSAPVTEISENIISLAEQRDLELFASINQSHPGLVGVFGTCHTSYGQQALKKVLANPTTNPQVLLQRQQFIKLLTEDTEWRYELEHRLKSIKSAEEALGFFSDAKNAEFHSKVMKNFFYKLSPLLQLNSSAVALDWLRVYDFLAIFSPLLEHLLFHFGMKWMRKATGSDHDHHHDHHDHHHDHFCMSCVAKKAIGLGTYAFEAIHLIFHLINFKEMVEHLNHKTEVLSHIHAQMVDIAKLVRSISWVRRMLEIRAGTRPFKIGGFDNIPLTGMDTEFAPLNEAILSNSFVTKIDKFFEKNRDLADLLNDEVFWPKNKLNLFSSVGKTLQAYSLFMARKEAILPALEDIGMIDALHAAARLVHEEKNRWTFVQYLSAPTPMIRFEQMTNPMLPADQAVSTSISLSPASGMNKLVITGPNKSGKSSFIKAVALNALLAQTLGIAAAHKAEMTPFARIITYITIADDISNDESMFVAELLRAKKCLATLSALEGNGFSLTIVDDSLFKSTDFEHGQAAAYKFVKDLGAFGSNITLVATHFEALTQLEQATGGLFKNYQMQIQTDATGQKQSSFQLKPGCSPRESVFDIISSGVNAPDYTASFLQ